MHVDGGSQDSLLASGVDNQRTAVRNAKPSVGWWRRASATIGTPAFGQANANGDAWCCQRETNTPVAATHPGMPQQDWELPILLCQWEARIFARLDDMRDRVCADAPRETRDNPSVKGDNGGCMDIKGISGAWSTMVEGRLSAIAEDIMHLHEVVHDLSRRLSSALEKERIQGDQLETDANVNDTTAKTGIACKKKRPERGRVSQKDNDVCLQKEMREAFAACTRDVRRSVREGISARERGAQAAVADQLRELNASIEGTVKDAINETAGDMVEGMLTRVYTVIARAIGEIRELAHKVDTYIDTQRLREEKQNTVVNAQGSNLHESAPINLTNDVVCNLARQTATQVAHETVQQVLKTLASTLGPAVSKELQDCVTNILREEIGHEMPKIAAALTGTLGNAAQDHPGHTHVLKHTNQIVRDQGCNHPHTRVESEPTEEHVHDENNKYGETCRVDLDIDQRDSVAVHGDRIGSLINTANADHNDRSKRANLGLHRLWEEESAGTEGWGESGDEGMTGGIENEVEELRTRNTVDAHLSDDYILKGRNTVKMDIGEEHKDQNLHSSSVPASHTPSKLPSFIRVADENSAENWQSDKLLS